MNGTVELPNAAVVEKALSRALASPVFVQAPRQSRLLRYIVEESAGGRGGRLGQFSIGIDVFDRGADFDPTTDSAVRVEVGRLRAKLREYYELHPSEAVVFRLPKGRYVADIVISDLAGYGDLSAPRSVADGQVSLLVLPFQNLGGDTSDDYFADGITDDLITDMAKLSGLKVIAHNSAFTYKGHKPTAEQLAQELGISHVLEGSVRRAGNRVRINAQLVDCVSGAHVWADRFDRDLNDIFALQDEVGRHIVNALSIALTSSDRFRFFDRRTDNLAAYDSVLRASRLDWSRSEIDQSDSLLRRAVELDPDYGLAHARRALNRWYAVFCGWIGDTFIEEILQIAARSIELDPDNSDVQSICSFVNFWNGSIDIADDAGDRSVLQDPANARVLERRAICLAYLDRFADADELLARAVTLNPHEPYYYPRGLLACMRGEYTQSIKLLRASAERFPTFLPTRIFLASLYMLCEETEQSREQIAAITTISPSVSIDRLYSGWGRLSPMGYTKLAHGFQAALDNANDN